MTGVHIKTLMANAHVIMCRIKAYLTNSLHDDSNETDKTVEGVCDNVENLLILWEGVLSNLHIQYPEEKDFDQTQEFIDAAVKLSAFNWKCQRLPRDMAHNGILLSR